MSLCFYSLSMQRIFMLTSASFLLCVLFYLCWQLFKWKELQRQFEEDCLNTIDLMCLRCLEHKMNTMNVSDRIFYLYFWINSQVKYQLSFIAIVSYEVSEYLTYSSDRVSIKIKVEWAIQTKTMDSIFVVLFTVAWMSKCDGKIVRKLLF